MINIWDAAYDVLFHPSNAMEEISAYKPIGQAAIVFLISILLPAVAVYFVLQAAGMGAFVNVMLAMHVLGSFALWVGGAALLNLFAELFGGSANAKGLFAALGFAHLPRILVVPVWVLSAFLAPGAQSLVMALSCLTVGLWTLCLTVAAVRAANRVGTARAVLVLAAPVLALLIMMVILMVFIGTALMRLPHWIW